MGFFDRFKGGKKNERSKPASRAATAPAAPKPAETKAAEKPAAKVPAPKGSTAYRALLRPLVSEKVSRLEKARQYAFAVSPRANKVEIKKAVERHYRVNVVGVNVVNVSGKKVRSGRTEGRRKDWRKAYVTVREGQSIIY